MEAKEKNNKRIIVTGGAGFIGSALIRHLLKQTNYDVLNIDSLTYAGNLSSLKSVDNFQNYHFEKADICDKPKISNLIDNYNPDWIINLAAETHVDRSINSPIAFINTNLVGTFNLLEATRGYWERLTDEKKGDFRFLHVSTDEVYGSLGEKGKFSEKSAYMPNSPYSASKAGSDHLIKAWYETYGLPTIVSNCSNNFGPYQYPEKLIPLSIINALNGKPINIYGDGKNIRDWLFVEDHVKALELICLKGRLGQTYNIGSNNEKSNLEVANQICEILDIISPKNISHKELITFVKDRPGHDRRYAIDATKIHTEIGWSPSCGFDDGLIETVKWYKDYYNWWSPIYNRQDK